MSETYRRLHSRLTLYYWACNKRSALFLRIISISWKHAEKVTQQFSSTSQSRRKKKGTNRVSRLSNPEDPFVFLSASDATPLSRVFNPSPNSPTVLIRINSKNSHFPNLLRFFLPRETEREREKRIKISFSPRSKNRRE